MSKLVAPMYVDKSRKTVLNRITFHVEQLYESSILKQGQKNPSTSRETVFAKHEALKEFADHNLSYERIARFLLPEPYEPANPSIPIEKLKKIHAKDLIIGKHHKGNYLKIRLATKAHRCELSIESVFEDEQGSYGIIRQYFQETDDSVDGHLPYGHVLLIRDPFLWDSGNDVAIVRVDHPTDLQFLYSWDQAAEKAIPSIWKGSIKMDSMKTESLIGLAELYNQSEDYQAALIRSYYTKKYEQCQEDLKALLLKDPKNHVYADLNQRTKERYEEVKYGKYNWRRMRHRGAGLYLDLDHADYTHPVRLKKTTKGRRVFTARDVKRGDLLMVVKALAIVPFEDSNSCFQLAYRNGKLETEFGVSAYLTQAILDRIKKEPPGWYEKTLSLMDDGGYIVSPFKNPDGTRVVDVFHVEEIRRHNSMNISNAPMQQHQAVSYLHSTSSPVSRITCYNSGIWFLPSFLRHSCLPNAHRSVLGDMLIVRAGCDIPKDTKITINCSTPSNWEYPMTNFTCTCPIHVHDVDMSNPTPSEAEKRRIALWREFAAECHRLESAKSKPEKWAKINIFEMLPSMLSKLDEIRQSLPLPSQIPQVQLAHRFRYVAAAYYGAGQRRHAQCAYYKVLDSLGVDYVVLEHLDEVVFRNQGQCCEDLLHAYRDLAALALTPGIKGDWYSASVDVYKILYGENISFEQVVPHVPFVGAKEKCPCVGIDDFATMDEKELKKRMDIDEWKAERWINTSEGLAMTGYMNLGARRAWQLRLEEQNFELELSAIQVVDMRAKKTKEREMKLERKLSKEEDEQKPKLEREREKKK
ncbi:hypothetical protein ABW20_dc0101945 [Dactylellina cionopaga]|nr:hypothetical protein ABW20_dc0101945 [Dactylellina cionopaga]